MLANLDVCDLNNATPRFRRQLILAGAIVAPFVAITIVTFVVNSSLLAEQQLQAVRTVDRIIAQFVRREERLPRDWGELRTVSPADIGGGYYLWPQDFELISTLVSVDFSTSLDTVQKQGIWRTLVAVRGHAYCEYNDASDFSNSRQAIQLCFERREKDRLPGPP